jgi:hypothetical protein
MNIILELPENKELEEFLEKLADYKELTKNVSMGMY